jgi:hypothetical protein
MKNALKALLDDLDRVYESHEEVGDTAVREALADAISQAFITPRAGYVLPSSFEMFSKQGDAQVRAALARFLSHAETVAAAKALSTPEHRLAAFQDVDVRSSAGRTYDEYFGESEAP